MTILKRFIVLLFSLILSLAFLLGFFKDSAFSKQRPSIIPPKAGNHKSLLSNSSCDFIKWFDPNTNDEEGQRLLKNCSSCHMAYYKEWKDDKHSMSQNNPFFLSVYNQFKRDHPDKNGNCALCHNPESVLDSRGVPMERPDYGIDLRERKAKNTNGISCDFCHKIESVDQNPLKKGIAGLTILQACEGMRDIRFGPIKDPIRIELVKDVAMSNILNAEEEKEKSREKRDFSGTNEELKYNSLYKTSLICAKCHDGSNGNVQIYSTFTEWVNSPAAKKGVQCQSCHMLPRERKNDMKSIVDNPNIKQKARPYYQVHSHSFLTNNPREFRKKYVDLSVKAGLSAKGGSTSGGKPASTGKTLIVTVKVTNNNTGHSFPTGSPMRNAILVIEAKDKNGKELKIVKGPRLPVYGGNLKNKPGKLFAKILSETYGEYGRSFVGARHGVPSQREIPPPDWWNVFIASDTRIKAGEEDVSVYEFASEGEGTQITAKLLWRNTWPGLAKLKGIELKEDLLIEKKIFPNY